MVPPGRGAPGTISISRLARAAMRHGEVRDGDLFHRADVIDAEMLALLAHGHDAGDQIVDEAEAACLLSAALNLET